MKKIIAIGTLTVLLVTTSAFGQGWLQLASARSQAWDGFTTLGVSGLSSHVDVCLFWAPGANVANPMPLANTPTTGNSSTLEPYTTAQAWNDLLASGFTLAQDVSLGNANVIVTTSSRGTVTYQGGSGWGLNGSAAGGTITLLEVGWNSAYATPAAAAAADSPIGWSYLNSFVLATSAADPTVLPANFTSFSVFTPAPEPSTMALAGLGGLSLLLFRRRK